MPHQITHHQLRWLEQEIPAWEREGLLSPGAADILRERYEAPPNRASQLGVIFVSALGACLIGAGVISLFAYNWDELGRPARAVLSLLPLVLMQGLAALTLWRWKNSAAVRESVCGGLILAIGAAISLIAQTYQIGGDFSQFMLTWFALALPAVYLLRSGLGFWLCQLGLLVWGGYAMDNHLAGAVWLPAIFATTLPYVFWIRKRPDHTVQSVMNKWALALAAPFALWFSLDGNGEFAWPVIFTAYFAAGLMLDQQRNSLGARPFALVGALMLAIYMLIFSFNGRWGMYFPPTSHPALTACTALGLAWLAGIIQTARKRRFWLLPLGILPAVLTGLHLIAPALGSESLSTQTLLEMILTLYTLVIGVLTIIAGARRQRLLVLNLGLGLISALAVCRFFDSSFGLVAKGTGFIVVGSLFIAANLITARLFKKKGPSHA